MNKQDLKQIKYLFMAFGAVIISLWALIYGLYFLMEWMVG